MKLNLKNKSQTHIKNESAIYSQKTFELQKLEMN